MNINFQELVIQIPVLLLALTFHEYAHGYVAYRLGDPTARNAGRLTLNPLKHLDPIGTLAFIFIKIGWAKPVPVNPRYFRNPKQDMLKVALAGPMTNLALAIICAILAKATILVAQGLPQSALSIAIFKPLALCFVYSVWINVLLCVFNFLPIPPLDGSKILMGVLPNQAAAKFAQFERYSFVLILILFFSGALGAVIFPIINTITRLLI